VQSIVQARDVDIVIQGMANPHVAVDESAYWQLSKAIEMYAGLNYTLNQKPHKRNKRLGLLF
jgi:hypothetical protein